MYRLYVYVRGIRLTSAPCPTPEVADRFLTALLGMPGVSGGDIEENIPGVGWCCYIPEPDRELLEIC